MNIFLFLLVGLIAGWTAGWITKRRRLGLIGSLVVGSIGALIGGFMFDKLDVVVPVNFSGSLITAVFGSVVFLFVFGRIFRLDS
jgi:uncharacterized membrane protein YeaQ/YmgE (transglycosylase-associated protein family)